MAGDFRSKGRALLYLRGVMLFLALLLPLLSLLPLGWLWLWEQGYALYWLGAAFVLGICSYLVQVWALRRAVRETAAPSVSEAASTLPPDPGWTARERAAWGAVEAIAANVSPAELTDRDKVLNLGLRTIEAVARQIHPEDRNPLWKFTIPEALALVERVSADMRPFVIDNIPLGDQLTVGQVLKIYRWRSAIGVAERAYDIWRLVRLINPVTAAAQEAREQITKRLYATVRDQLARQLASGYVREVGRAAIDLYGGRLKVSPTALAGHISASTLRDRLAGGPRAEPLRILLAGRPASGKSSVVNALAVEVGAPVEAPPATRKFHAYEIELAGLARSLVIDSPGIGATVKEQRRFAEKAGESDLIVWVLDATRPDDATDEAAIAGVRAYFAERPHRRQPPILVALTHVDQLPPREARAVTETAAGRLGLPLEDVVPLSLAEGREPHDVKQLSERIAAHAPEAQRAQLLRLMEDAAPRWSAGRIGRQTSNAVVSAARAVVPGYFKRLLTRKPSR